VDGVLFKHRSIFESAFHPRRARQEFRNPREHPRKAIRAENLGVIERCGSDLDAVGANVIPASGILMKNELGPDSEQPASGIPGKRWRGESLAERMNELNVRIDIEA
jgi:hypothetical protein